jgi:hypothetical protein
VAWALGRIGSPEAVSGLTQRLRVEMDAAVRDEINDALQESRSLVGGLSSHS